MTLESRLKKLVMLFPGQGSQSVGMLNDVFAESAAARQALEEADEALGFALSAVIQDGPAEQLDTTEFTQPAMLAADVAVYRAWRALGGPAPDWVAGHSLGEYAALVVADALSLGDAVKLARLRGQAMQAAVPAGEGAMAAVVGLDDDAVQALCAEYAQGDVLEPVNFNAPGQVVIAGHGSAVARAREHAKSHGARMVVPLPVSVPSHCSLMGPAAEALEQALEQIELRSPACPVVHNVTATPEDDLASMRARLTEQVKAPVRWVQSIEYLAGAGGELFLECGPGKVLTGLMRRIDRSLSAHALGDWNALQSALKDVEEAVT